MNSWPALAEAVRWRLKRYGAFGGADDQRSPETDWLTWLIMAGRGYGKTRAGAEWIRAVARHDGNARIALVGASLHEVRSVMVEGESGLLAVTPQREDILWEPSLRRIAWPSGARAMLYSASEPNSLRGPQHSHAWCDEIAKWHRGGEAWDNLMLGMRLGDRPRVVATTTPRAVALIKRLVEEAKSGDGKTIITRGRTRDNRLHLAPAFLAAIEKSYAGTRIGRQELDGELIEDVEGSLWPRALIEACRVDPGSIAGPGPVDPFPPSIPCPVRPEPVEGRVRNALRRAQDKREKGKAQDKRMLEMKRIVIAVDPPAGAGPGSDACGIVAVGLGEDDRGYVLADASVQGLRPEGWARKVADTAEIWNADRVIAEANQGGAMVRSVLNAAGHRLPLRLIHASRSKSARAEPVAALYETDQVSHAGTFPALEDEMAGMTIEGGYAGPGRSPDRADALVYALTELLLGEVSEPGVRGL